MTKSIKRSNENLGNRSSSKFSKNQILQNDQKCDDDESSELEENSRNNEDSSSDLVKSHNLKKDYKNIAFLLFLYFLQGVPLGLTGSLPYILSSRKVSYADQGTFSFAFWPFSLKLLWAPIVDSIFIRKFGRRKSWLIPTQYGLGIFMIAFSGYIRDILEVPHHNSHQGYI
jgi:PAT family acetyl-CoA transporter-like MFS transporter 1